VKPEEGQLEAHWRLIADGLVVARDDDRATVPTADDVFAAEFRTPATSGDGPHYPPPSGELTEVTFSRIPLDISAILVPPGREPFLTVRLSASRRGREWDVTQAVLLGADHAVCDGVWYPFRPGVLGEILALLDGTDVVLGESLSLGQYLDLAREARDSGILEDRVGNGAEFWSQYEVGELRVPPLFEGIMYPYQLAGYRWLSFVGDESLGGILADEMGLGKTVQVIALMLRVSDSPGGACLVVCPATLLENWRREIERFAPSLAVCVHRGASRTGRPSTLMEADVVITSYETACHDVELFRMIDWCVLVADEAQAIKNPKARRTKALKALPRRCSIAVTGTPLENRLTDVWSLCDFVMSGYLGTQREFENRFDDSVGSAGQLEPMISPLLLRRRVRDVAKDLPELIDTPEAIELDETASARYQELLSEARGRFSGAFDLGVLATLRMYCAHPFLIDSSDGDLAEASTKYRRMLELLQEMADSGEKALVFCAFRKMLDLIVADLNRRGLPTSWIDGRIPVAARQAVIDEFSELSGPGALVLNPHAAGTGLNIVAANHVIHYTLEWNPAVIDQASARAYRRGQDRPVSVHRLFHSSTVEDVMNDRLQHKRDLADTAIVGIDGRSESLRDLVKALNLSPT